MTALMIYSVFGSTEVSADSITGAVGDGGLGVVAFIS